MIEQLNPGIEALRQKISAKEEELNNLKMVVNGLCADEKKPPLYPNVDTKASATSQLRSDLFYAETMAGAARQYLEMRKASGQGAASVETIYQALKTGGYRFETKNEENAKTGVRISLRKNSRTFHRLPNGEFGLCTWYGVTGMDEDSDTGHKKKRGKHRKRHAATNKATQEPANNGEKPEAKPVSNGADIDRRKRTADASITTPTGVVTVKELQDQVKQKSLRINVVAKHFGVDESSIKKLLEPASNVYLGQRGWLKVRE